MALKKSELYSSHFNMIAWSDPRGTFNHAGEIGSSETNPYLFRRTERFLFEHGLKPLSAIKDMIGSQATKGMHVLAKFAPKVLRCGVWTGAAGLTVIEAYPSACKGPATVKGLRQRFGSLGHGDLDDALTCALKPWPLHRNRCLPRRAGYGCRRTVYP